MVLLIRVILIATIIYLLVKSFVNFFADEAEKEERREREKNSKSKGVSKNVGDYVDYEEVD
jgi:large-conductance mechanosensitive channel